MLAVIWNHYETNGGLCKVHFGQYRTHKDTFPHTKNNYIVC